MVKRFGLAIMTAAAGIYRARADILEVVGAAVIVAGVARASTTVALVLAGVALLAKSFTVGS